MQKEHLFFIFMAMAWNLESLNMLGKNYAILKNNMKIKNIIID